MTRVYLPAIILTKLCLNYVLIKILQDNYNIFLKTKLYIKKFYFKFATNICMKNNFAYIIILILPCI